MIPPPGDYNPHAWTSDDLARIARDLDPLFPIDLGIVRAVKILRDSGFDTIESCEGADGHSYPEPTVLFSGGPETGWGAISALMTYGLPLKGVGQMWSFTHGVPTGPHWVVTFWREV